LHWRDVHLEEACVTLDAAASKVRRRRVVPLEPEALEWLKLAQTVEAKLPIAAATRARYLNFGRRVLGLRRWPHDCLRHSASSYLLARHKDPARVAYGLGHSVSILIRHYAALVRAKDAEAFWQISPTSVPQDAPETPPAPSVPILDIDPNSRLFVRAGGSAARGSSIGRTRQEPTLARVQGGR